MPNSPALWVAAGMLWIMDGSINISMEPFRSFVGDNLPSAQRTTGFAMQSFLIGTGAAMVTALICDRVPFLRAGLLPIGNFVAALPINGLAPILVMWFGFGWQSKAAVVVAMVFFPMLVNVVAGLAASERMQRDLMATWGASYWQSLWKLRLPAAMPFVIVETQSRKHSGCVSTFLTQPTRGYF